MQQFRLIGKVHEDPLRLKRLSPPKKGIFIAPRRKILKTDVYADPFRATRNKEKPIRKKRITKRRKAKEAYMSINTDLNKLSKTELMAMLEAKLKAEAGGLMVKRNASGGVYIRHPSFKEFSDSKQKEYVAGINIPAATAVALFSNPALFKEIGDAIKAL